jgi:hypothetical protein
VEISTTSKQEENSKVISHEQSLDLLSKDEDEMRLSQGDNVQPVTGAY